MGKDTKQLIKKCQKIGFRVEFRGKHVMLVGPKGELFTLSRTASDHRALKNMRGDIKRAGYVV